MARFYFRRVFPHSPFLNLQLKQMKNRKLALFIGFIFLMMAGMSTCNAQDKQSIIIVDSNKVELSPFHICNWKDCQYKRIRRNKALNYSQIMNKSSDGADYQIDYFHILLPFLDTNQLRVVIHHSKLRIS